MKIGHPSADPPTARARHFGRTAGLAVDSEGTGVLADGDLHKRVIGFDSETGAFQALGSV